MKISYYTKLTGTSFQQDVIKEIRDGKTLLRGIPDPKNEYDNFAVKVEALVDGEWKQIGWIPKGKNQTISQRLIGGLDVSIYNPVVTGLDKGTLGVNVSVEYGDSGLDPADLQNFEHQKVWAGDDHFVWFDPVNHKAYSEQGTELLSGSNAEKMFSPDFNPVFPARALSKTTGVKADDIVAVWENKRDLAADYGTLVHRALESYLPYADELKKLDKGKHRPHSASNWMNKDLGRIVDEFVRTSGIQSSANVECRIKWGKRTGIADLVIMDERGHFTLYDYKIMPEIKEVNFIGYGRLPKYTIQQNFYREILEDTGLVCDGMYLWNYNGKEWKKVKVETIPVKSNL